jgi:hypothetical protein
MKRSIKAIAGMLLGALLVLAGCTDTLNSPESESAAPGTAGKALVRISHGEAGTGRTLMPEFTGLTYELTFAGPPEENHGPETVTLGEPKEITLAQAQWTITATAKTGQTATARGEWTGAVGSGTTEVSIQLEPITGGKGNLSYTVTFPASATGSLTLTPDGGSTGTPVTLTSGQPETINDLNAGAYLLNITLNDGMVTIARTEAAHIYAGLTTSAVYEITGAEFRKPAAPAAPTVTADGTTLTVTWTTVTGAETYEVWRGTNSDGTGRTQFTGTIDPTGTTITGLSNATTYYTWIRAKNSAGTSDFSLASNSALTAPTYASVTVTPGDRELAVSWDAVATATAYEVWYGTTDNEEDPTTVQFGTDVTTTSATITGLENGTTYYVWVKAKNSGGTSGFAYSGISGTPAVGNLPAWLSGSFNAHINGYTPPDFYDDGFTVDITAKTFSYYMNSARTPYWSGTIVTNITNAGTTADPNILIIKVTASGGSWYAPPPSNGKYTAVAYTDFGTYTTFNTAYKSDGNNAGTDTAAEAITEYTMTNGYYSSMNAYARYYPVTVTAVNLAAFQGTWASDDDEYLTLTIAGIAVGYGYDDDNDDTFDGMNETNNGMGQIVAHTDLSADEGLLYVANQLSDYGSDGFFILAWHWTNRTSGQIEWELLDDNYDVWDTLEDAQAAYADADSVSFSLGFTKQ